MVSGASPFNTGPAVLVMSGNDIYENVAYEVYNESGSSVLADGNYWGEPTTSELEEARLNLSRIYDRQDNASYGPVQIGSYALLPVVSGQMIKPRLVMTQVVGIFAITVNGSPGEVWRIEATEDLGSGEWVLIGIATIGNEPSSFVDLGSLTMNKRFYRCIQVE